MKILNIRKGTTEQDAFSTVAALNYALKLFGLSCVYRDGANLKYSNPIWKFSLCIILFFAVNAYCVYFKLQNDNGHTKFTLTEAIQLAYLLGYIQYIADIICVYKYGRQSYIDYFNLYDYIDCILGMHYYNQNKKCIRNMCLIYIIIAVLTIIIELCTWTINFNWTVISIYFVELLYLVMKMLAILDIIANCVQVKYRLETIGDFLENYYCHVDNFHGSVKDVIYDQVQITQYVSKININRLSAKRNGRNDIILQLSRCYILLVDQSDFINLKYGVRVLLSCSFYLLDMVLFVNLIIRLYVGTLVVNSHYISLYYLIILSTIARILSYTVILFYGIHRCEQTYRQTERIVQLIDHLLVNKQIAKEMQETFKALKNVIISRPIVYHALNFYRLDYTVLVAMASVIATYTIIILDNL